MSHVTVMVDLCLREEIKPKAIPPPRPYLI